jgi:hypothetical protein
MLDGVFGPPASKPEAIGPESGYAKLRMSTFGKKNIMRCSPAYAQNVTEKIQGCSE